MTSEPLLSWTAVLGIAGALWAAVLVQAAVLWARSALGRRRQRAYMERMRIRRWR